VAPPPAGTNGPVSTAGTAAGQITTVEPGEAQQQQKKKRGFFSRLFGRGDKSDEEQNNGTGAPQNGNNGEQK
jgi:hypothetical protein